MGLHQQGDRMPATTIKEFSASDILDNLDGLAEVLHASVETGASVNFVHPHSLEDSRAFWRDKVLPHVSDGGRILLVALIGREPVGTVQLDIDMPPNQVHRGEVAKLLVHPKFRKRGIAKLLMAALEQRARDLGKRLITLDTRTGDGAERLYHALGYRTAGVIPGYCRDVHDADRYDSTTYMYKAF